MAATAKRDLTTGEALDGEGGYTVYGKLLPARTSLVRGALPIGLAQGVTLTRPVAAGETIQWSDITVDQGSEALHARKEMETRYRSVFGID